MGRNELVNRLASQVGSRNMAIGLLIKRGDLKPDGKTFTPQGVRKNAMTASERAIVRAEKSSSHNASEYKYSKETNRATLKQF